MRHDVAEGVSLSYGLRLDGQSFELADGTTHEDAGVSANAAVDVALAEGLFLTAGAATVWGGYELSEASLINFFGEWDYGPVSTQRSYNGRVGLRYETGPFTFSGAVFRTQVEDVDFILSAARTPVVDVVSQGVTAGVGYEAETAYIRVNYTFADVTADGAPIGSTAYYVGRPAGHLFGAEAAWDVTPQWRIGGSLEAAAENGEYAPALPGYLTGDVYAEWRPTYVPGMTLRFEVRNVGDATYAARSSDGNGLSNVVVLNEPGRSFGLTLTQRF